ncbi:MAG: O-antigen ligase family protein [Leptospirales bacterium]
MNKQVEGSLSSSKSFDAGSFSPSYVPKISWPYYAIAVFLGTLAALDTGIPSLLMIPLSITIFIALFFKSIGHPIYALMALIVYIPYAKAVSGNMEGAVTGLNFTTALMLISILGMYSRLQGSQMEPALPLEQTFRRLVTLFCLMGAISVLHADLGFAGMSVMESLVDYKRWLEPFLVFFLFTYLVREEEEGRILIYLMAFTMVMVGIGSFWERHELENRSHLVRLAGIAGQANTMGAFYANYIFLILAFLVMKGRKIIRKSFFMLGFLGCLVGLFTTESRGDALGMAGGVLLYSFVRSKLAFLGIVAGLAFLFFNVQFLPAGLRARVEHTVVHQNNYGFSESTQLDASAQTRLVLWTGAVRMIMAQPVFGVGEGMFHEYIYQYVDHTEKTANLDLRGRDGHNAYLMIGAEMGAPALLLFLTLIFFMFRIAIRSYRSSSDLYWKTVSACCLGSLASLVITNMFGSRAISLILSGYLWALLAILLKVPKWKQKGSAECG